MARSWISMCLLLTAGSHLPSCWRLWLSQDPHPPQGCMGEVVRLVFGREGRCWQDLVHGEMWLQNACSHLVWAKVAETAAREFEERCSVELSRLWACEV